MVIGLSGYAKSGKDFFFKKFSKTIEEKCSHKFKCIRSAFADQLKEDLKDILNKNFNIDVFNPTPTQKELIRPLLVCYGTDIARKINKNYWIDKISSKIESEQDQGNLISIITDVRYPNEQKYIKENFHNSLNIHIERVGVGPANSEEENSNNYLINNADQILRWGNFEDSPEINKAKLDVIVDLCISKNKIENRPTVNI